MAEYRNRSRDTAERLFKLRDYLYANASPTHAVKMSDILTYFANEGHKVEIKTAYSDLKTLETDFGLNIQYDGKQRGYLLLNPPFEPYELRLIVNSIQSARFITQQEADRLTQKVMKLADKYTRPSLRRKTYIHNRIRAINEDAMQGLDAVYDAIAQDRKISYRCFQYVVENCNIAKSYCKENDSTIIEASPYRVFWQDGKFLVYAIQKIPKDVYRARYFEHTDEEPTDGYEFDDMDDTGLYVYDLCLLDLEHMDRVKVVDKKREGEGTIQKYLGSIDKSSNVFSERMKLKVSNVYLADVINKFGNEISILPLDHTFFIATINEEPTPELYMWTREFFPPIEIISPENMEAKLKSHILNLLKDDDPNVQLFKEIAQATEEFLSE